jgi:sec-independent protein translocase protein TatA
MKAFLVSRILVVLAASLYAVTKVASFAPSPSTAATSSTVVSGPFQNKNPHTLLSQENVSPVLARQRRSVASVQTCGLFGLGLPEIALILVAVVFLVGPEKLGELVRESGKTARELADELKNVPEEFQKGMEEGESEARSRKAKQMKPVDKDNE